MGLVGRDAHCAVTFIDNHDTFNNHNHGFKNIDEMNAGYAYILTHPGIPCVFWS